MTDAILLYEMPYIFKSPLHQLKGLKQVFLFLYTKHCSPSQTSYLKGLNRKESDIHYVDLTNSTSELHVTLWKSGQYGCIFKAHNEKHVSM
jgi:hypothetical protein